MSEAQWSEIEVASVKDKSRLITLKSVQPLKILNPACLTAAHAVLSGYGGGLVAGDKVNLSINVQESSRFLLTTQSNSRVFKSENGKAAEQIIRGKVGKNGLAVFFPDPLIPHTKSIISQNQAWELEEGSVLLTVDWFSSGRAESGEQFSFTGYHSSIHIQKNGIPFLVDNLSYAPEGNNPRSTGIFGRYNHFINGFLAGDESGDAFQELSGFFHSLNTPADSGHENYAKGQQDLICVADEIKPGLISFRAMGIRRLDLDPFIRRLAAHLAADNLLGFDFYTRRF